VATRGEQLEAARVEAAVRLANSCSASGVSTSSARSILSPRISTLGPAGSREYTCARVSAFICSEHTPFPGEFDYGNFTLLISHTVDFTHW
jgi:hypothetical protein